MQKQKKTHTMLIEHLLCHGLKKNTYSMMITTHLIYHLWHNAENYVQQHNVLYIVALTCNIYFTYVDICKTRQCGMQGTISWVIDSHITTCSKAVDPDAVPNSFIDVVLITQSSWLPVWCVWYIHRKTRQCISIYQS